MSQLLFIFSFSLFLPPFFCLFVIAVRYVLVDEFLREEPRMFSFCGRLVVFFFSVLWKEIYCWVVMVNFPPLVDGAVRS